MATVPATPGPSEPVVVTVFLTIVGVSPFSVPIPPEETIHTLQRLIEHREWPDQRFGVSPCLFTARILVHWHVLADYLVLFPKRSPIHVCYIRDDNLYGKTMLAEPGSHCLSLITLLSPLSSHRHS